MVPPDERHQDRDKEPVTYIGAMIEQYLSEHSHRSSGTRYASEASVNPFLTSTALHENLPLE